MGKDQIEKMAKVIGDTWLVDLEGETKGVCEVLDEVDIKAIARELYEQDYRKVPEDSVVLSREELSEEPYNDFCKGCPNVRVRSSGMTDCCADYSCEQFQKYARLLELYEQSRKETAREILNELIDSSNKITFFDCRMALGLDKLAKKYGVEIKE